MGAQTEAVTVVEARSSRLATPSRTCTTGPREYRLAGVSPGNAGFPRASTISRFFAWKVARRKTVCRREWGAL